jgi:hypothetical protein
MKIKEDFLQYLWRTKQLDFQSLETTKQEAIEILDFGEHNTNAGPDFLNAKIKIGETIWAGNVEVHVKASEWIRHNHQANDAYNNVILHVVYEEDAIIKRKTGELIPCLELRRRIPADLSNQYLRLIDNEDWIPCESQFHSVSDINKAFWLDRLLVERLEGRIGDLEDVLAANNNNWASSFYQRLARNFGAKINTQPFELLAKNTPILTLAKHKNDLFQLEALLFGQAGYLEVDFEEEYPNRLKKEYQFLQKKYDLQPFNVSMWKFMRLRPANFPTVRIAQFAALIHQSTHLFSKIIDAKKIEEVRSLFENIEISEYWLTHYKFDKISRYRTKKLGKSTIDLLIINTIIPFLFFYGRFKQLEDYEDKALLFLEKLAPESNSIIDNWKSLKMKPKSAYQTQALLELKRRYCDEKRCLECAIGNQIMKG